MNDRPTVETKDGALYVDWESLGALIAMVHAGTARRLDGAGVSVYAVGSNLIRVDLRVSK